MSKGEQPDRENLAAQRTVMAAERTLMAWTRTSLAMITFGFTIYKFLQYLFLQGNAEPVSLRRPRRLSLVLIAAGVLFMVLASLQFRHELKTIAPGRPVSLWRLPLALAIFMVIVGILAFVEVLWRAGPL
jgi:putative membrane protein